MRMVRIVSPVPYESLPSVRQDLTFVSAERVFAERGMDLGPRQMESLGMRDGTAYTNLGYMLSDQFDLGFKMAVFEDLCKLTFRDREETTGSVLEQFERACEFVDRHSSRRSRISGPRRLDSRDYPEEAVREAIANAIAHRDYGIRGDASISMYGDRMTVLSVGGLNAGTGIDDIVAGASSRRNPGLASILCRLGIMGACGTGIPRMMGLYRNQPVKPRIETTANSFKVILPKTFQKELSEDELRVMDLFAERSSIRRTDVESSLGISKTKASGILSSLEDLGLIVRNGSGRDVSYSRKFDFRCNMRSRTNTNA